MKGKKQSCKIAPDNYEPCAANELIGPARGIALALLAEIRETKLDPNARFKFLGYGPPGVGKTRISWMLANEISTSWDIEAVNGRNIDLEVVRAWQHGGRYGSLFGGWKVKLIHEADRLAAFAQDLLLTYLDELPGRTAVIATSNLDVTALTDRFQTRFRLVRVDGPTHNELAAWLANRWKLPKAQANFIALGACGNVRQALLDAKNYGTFKKTEHRPKAPVVVVDVKRQDAAHKAWETMRKKKEGKAA